MYAGFIAKRHFSRQRLVDVRRGDLAANCLERKGRFFRAALVAYSFKLARELWVEADFQEGSR